jgi:hypothetical protein
MLGSFSSCGASPKESTLHITKGARQPLGAHLASRGRTRRANPLPVRKISWANPWVPVLAGIWLAREWGMERELRHA